MRNRSVLGVRSSPQIRHSWFRTFWHLFAQAQRCLLARSSLLLDPKAKEKLRLYSLDLLRRWHLHEPSFLLSGQEGSSLLELALVTPLLLLVLVGSVDLGRACYAAIEVAAAANAGAAYGTQNPTDTAGMQSAALLNGANLNGLSATASWGCECSDGTSPSPSCTTKPSCSANLVKYVAVTTSLGYAPALHVPGLPSSFPLQASSRLRAAN